MMFISPVIYVRLFALFARARKVKENRVFAFCTKNQQKKYGKHKP
jgi:hypothetical protein